MSIAELLTPQIDTDIYTLLVRRYLEPPATEEEEILA